MSKVIDQFPLTPGPRILVCSGLDDTRRSFRSSFNRCTVPIKVPDPATPDLQWHPVAKIQVQGESIGQVMGSGPQIVVNDELIRVVFWLTQAECQNGSTTAPDIDWQLRASTDCTPEVIGTGKIHLKDIGSVGVIVWAGGHLGNGYELWMRVDEHTANAKVMLLDIEVRASRFHGGDPMWQKGSVSI